MNLHTPSPERAPTTKIDSLADFMAQPDKVEALLRQSDDGKIYVLLETKPNIRHGELRDGLERINSGSEGPLNECGVQVTHVGPKFDSFTHLSSGRLAFIGCVDRCSGMIETLIESDARGGFRDSSIFIDLDSCRSLKEHVIVQKLIGELHTNLVEAFGGSWERDAKDQILLKCWDITSILKTVEHLTNTKLPTALRIAIVDFHGPLNMDAALKLLVHTADYVAQKERNKLTDLAASTIRRGSYI